MSRSIRTVLHLLGFLVFSNVFGQTNDFLLKQADGYFKNGQYFKAVLIYQQLHKSGTLSPELILRRSICEYETNHIDTAESIVKELIKTKYAQNVSALYLLGKIYMSSGRFDEAALQFKKLLNVNMVTPALKSKVIDEIKRCGSAVKLAQQVDQTLVESAGAEVNTIWDEINPVQSINIDTRFYFNSNRESAGIEGNTNPEYELPYDMYGCSLINAEWSDIGPLNVDLNTKGHDLLLDFDERGQVVYFKTGEKWSDLVFLTDTFVQNNSVNKLGALDLGFLHPADDIFFFTDSIVLFSSVRAEGFGGFDIYYSRKQNGQWSTPKNLGPSINTPYDEINPFLVFDGRTLIFSSNNTESMGGFDLFTSKYDDKSMAWATPSNLGMPVNSGDDEKYFRLDKSRLSAMFSSNRKSGKGGYDIYFAYFRQAWSPQVERSNPMFFADVRSFVLNRPLHKDPSGSEVLQKINLANQTVYYESTDQLSLPAITRQFDQVIEVFASDPRLNLTIEVFSDQETKSPGQDLVYSIKRAEAVKTYFVSRGIKPSRIVIKGYGSNFPIALETINGKINQSGKSLNKRIEFSFFVTDPVTNNLFEFGRDTPKVNSIMSSEAYAIFRMSEHELNYKILLISSSNPANLENYINDEHQLFFIEKNNSTGKYELLTTGYALYSAAYKEKKIRMTQGYEDATVLAYHDNNRMATNLLAQWSARYPDLVNYIYRSE
ncbi:MAG: OmpA family protein [Saprospiraceae bacterium]|nr:OmpA family protein [Saprospiraceae bacterium]